MRRCIPLVLAFAGCAGPPQTARSATSARLLPADSPVGLSGLTTDPFGTLWAIPERSREIVALQRRGDVVTVGSRLRLVGVPDELETESITWLGGSLVALGTEAAGTRPRDLILIAQRVRDRFAVTDSLILEYAPWGVSGIDNEGIEGLCAAGGQLFAAGEVVLESSEGPYAPLGIFDLGTRTWTHTKLPLTSSTGKIAGLDCRERDGAVELIAIERHFDVRRVLAATITRDPPLVTGQRIAADVSDVIGDNVEGITFGSGEWLMITDNHFKNRRDGPGKLVAVRGN